MTRKRTRADLSKEAILDAAIVLVKRDGMDFSMRDLGEELSSWPNTVYAFFQTKRALQDALLDRIVGEALTDQVVDRLIDANVPWQDRLRSFGLAIFDTLSKYPGAGHLITHFGMVGSSNGMRLFQLMIHFHISIGLAPDRAATALQASAFFLLEISDLAASKAIGQANSTAMSQSALATDKQSEIAQAVAAMVELPIRERALAGLDLFIAGLEREI